MNTLIFFTIISLEILLAILVSLKHKKIVKRYTWMLSSGKEATFTLETYSRLIRPVNIRVNASIKFPAKCHNELLLINKKFIYLTDLFTNIYLITQLELSSESNLFFRSQKKILSFIFLFTILAFVVGFILNSELGTLFIFISNILALSLLFLTFFFQELIKNFYNNVLEIGIDILDLDEIETLRARNLLNELSLNIYTYPLDLLKAIVRFILPF